MDSFARRAAAERAELFLDAVDADVPVRDPSLIEKDFWVCWILGRLFRADAPFGVLFKGGTSLSKAYHVIERFSEDIDLSIDRHSLGFRGDRDPALAGSGKQAKRLIDELRVACQEFVGGPVLEWLETDVASVLGPAGASGRHGWIEVDERDPDRQTLLFRYPPTAVTGKASGYNAPEVRLEFGARGDQWPSEQALVRAYVAEAFPDEFAEPSAAVRVLSLARTFWEKATILHALHHGGAKRVGPRHSRHYYDLSCLAAGPARDVALSKLDLLSKVAEHKSCFFRAGWARYDEARPGTLRLVPPSEVVGTLRADFRKMEAMFFGEPPDFDEILARIAKLEAGLNESNARAIPAGTADT